jgi:hypothetical protein
MHVVKLLVGVESGCQDAHTDDDPRGRFAGNPGKCDDLLGLLRRHGKGSDDWGEVQYECMVRYKVRSMVISWWKAL